ncbi:MAG: ABC transporter substrate-binding protein, partial [Candidatus Dormibacteria bacterium]
MGVRNLGGTVSWPPGVAGVACAALLAACGPFTGNGAARDGVISVVAAENVWGNIAEQLGGGHVSLTSVVTDRNTDPHE